MAQFDYQRRDSAEELLAGWMGELEAVLYSSEVEEAIKEVRLALNGRNATWPFIYSCFVSGLSKQQSTGQERL